MGFASLNRGLYEDGAGEDVVIFPVLLHRGGAFPAGSRHAEAWEASRGKRLPKREQNLARHLMAPPTRPRTK